MPFPVDAGDRGAESQVDVVLAVPVPRMDVDRVAFGLARQVVLGQRRPLVGPFVLVADQHDRAVESLGAQRLRGLGPGQARSGDNKRFICGHCLTIPSK